jgi:hypothetical protein
VEEILHQLVDGQNPIKIPSFTVFHSFLMVPLFGAGFHPQQIILRRIIFNNW